jgi:hypothetical protein
MCDQCTGLAPLPRSFRLHFASSAERDDAMLSITWLDPVIPHNLRTALRVLPRGAEWGQLPASRRKLHAEDFIAGIVEHIENLGREPDAWESAALTQGIGLGCAGMYTAALVYAAEALRPSSDRRPVGSLEGETCATVQALRHGLHSFNASDLPDWAQ